MSFFRSAQDDSESGDISFSQEASSTHEDNDDEDEDLSIGPARLIGSRAVSGELDTSDAFSPSSAPASFHTQGLLHSLLEERCMYQALEELRNKGLHIDSVSHPEVRALGYKKYLRISRSLGGLGVVKQGVFDNQHYSPLRQNYLDGLDLLAQQSSTPTRPQMQKAVSQMDLAVPETFRKYVAAQRDMQEVDRQLSMMTVAERRPDLNVPRHPLLDDTKYGREFDEFGVLGKGGYGVVFHVKHKLDGSSYAIKKIPMGSRRIRRIQQHGSIEMDEILLELRTLARLNHPNIVRYQTGWLEYSSFAPKRDVRPNVRKLLDVPERSTETENTAPSIDIQFEFDEDLDPSIKNGFEDNDEEQGIVFEDSENFGEESDRHSNSLSVNTASLRDNALEKMRSRNTLASVSDEEVDSIPRYVEPSSTSGQETSFFSEGGTIGVEPCLALNIQMSLYTMTVADFLSPGNLHSECSTAASLRHCFHPPASFSLLLAIMDGVRYLHREGVVHRDLKPGNVFLAVRPGVDCPPGAIDLSSCTYCNEAGNALPFNMDACIGDFGLVTSIARAEDEVPVAPSRIVGTEIYRPESITRDNHPSLDVFALGIIAFELFWKFGTRMERHEILHALKKGNFPKDFDDKVRCPGLQQFIKSMVLASERECPSWESLRRGAIALMGRC